jgi:hypothetical protein
MPGSGPPRRPQGHETRAGSITVAPEQPRSLHSVINKRRKLKFSLDLRRPGSACERKDSCKASEPISSRVGACSSCAAPLRQYFQQWRALLHEHRFQAGSHSHVRV